MTHYETLGRLEAIEDQNKTDRKKQELLRLARSGYPKPDLDSVLGRALKCYKSKKSSSYDPMLLIMLNKANPNWLKGKLNKSMEHKKKLLLAVAKKSGNKPHKNDYLGMAWYKLSDPNNSFYDQKFTNDIYSICPHWVEEEQISI